MIPVFKQFSDRTTAHVQKSECGTAEFQKSECSTAEFQESESGTAEFQESECGTTDSAGNRNPDPGSWISQSRYQSARIGESQESQHDPSRTSDITVRMFLKVQDQIIECICWISGNRSA